MSPGPGVGQQRASVCSVLLLTLQLTRAQLTHNVGCLFSDIVCTPNEVCFNDLVIGRCISASSDTQHVERLGPLAGPQLGLLEAEMSRVFGLGFSWPDAYTQCVFQTLIYSIQHRLPYSQDQCGNFLDNLENIDDTDREGDDEEVYFVPDTLDPEDDADDDNEYLYKPEDLDDIDAALLATNPGPQQQEAWLHLDNVLHKLRAGEPPVSEYILVPDQLEEEGDTAGELGMDGENIVMLPVGDGLEERLPVAVAADPLPQLAQVALDDDIPDYHLGDLGLLPVLGDPEAEAESHPVEKREAADYLDTEDEDGAAARYGYVVSAPGDADYVLTPDDLEDYSAVYQPAPDTAYLITEDGTEDAEEDGEKNNWVAEEEDQDDTNTRPRRADKETLMNTIYPDDSENDISNYDFEYDDSDESVGDDDILYYNPDNEPIEVESVFDRRGRLDVKKPGPFYSNSPNNFYLDKLQIDNLEDEEDLEDDPGQTEYEYPLAPAPAKKGDTVPSVIFEEPAAEANNYLYVNIQDRFQSLGQANQLWQYVADHLEVPKEAFTFKPETSRIILKVNSNPRQLNATTMAKLLEADTTLREHANNDLGVEIASFEVGDANNNVMSVYSGPSQLFLLLFLLAAGIAALLLAAAVLLFIRRRSQNNKEKQLEDDVKIEKEEPVKEYKQLVRDWSRSSRASQASAAEQPAQSREKAGAESRDRASPNKILNKAATNSEGSRTSSTSSWQEEPGVNCMDISTGHMVLSYMEDHLTNKQRLEQEWVGLCAYEAEPNSTSTAFKVENKKKNRYPDKLPYDHNRVMLNALVNGSNSDYINASSVMDHDPRNPAYIITQGAMTNTTADFWQMVWEQGSVVIVMLSKLSENGYQLCHRYWPEEGSEQYHIFEVHLVSEHVWCDDYLVRSLYLKNNQTGETRTVTQFHFLSWPDGNIPASTKSILEFRRKVNKSYRGRSCPMIVHCSDGVGRAGTYVLIDMVLNRMMKGSKEIDIAATLEHIRDQRSGMVQTRSQFEFCLMAVAEETHAILKALPQ